MSRVGNTPISLSKGVKIEISDTQVVIKGPLGTLECQLHRGIDVEIKDDQILVKNNRKRKDSKAIHGLIRSLIANHVRGVSEGWKKTLELVGVGYRARLEEKKLILSVGFSHPVIIEPPNGIDFAMEDKKVIVSGIDKQLVGQVAAKIRAVKKPEPYKGKGIRYEGEVVRKKAGKAAKAIGGGVPGS